MTSGRPWRGQVAQAGLGLCLPPCCTCEAGGRPAGDFRGCKQWALLAAVTSVSFTCQCLRQLPSPGTATWTRGVRAGCAPQLWRGEKGVRPETVWLGFSPPPVKHLEAEAGGQGCRSPLPRAHREVDCPARGLQGAASLLRLQPPGAEAELAWMRGTGRLCLAPQAPPGRARGLGAGPACPCLEACVVSTETGRT